jgi:TRAP-type C4-dicarboxylate transport system permease small subunit
MMLLTFVDVVARYVVNRPVRGAFEVTELMLLVLIFAGLPLVSFTDEHALMDFIDRLLGRRAQRWLEGACRCSAGPHAPPRLDRLAQGRPDLGLP